MMNALVLTVSGSLAASIVVKATFLAALGLFLAWLARRNPAAVRHAVLTATFGVLLVLPVVSLVAPPLRVLVRERAAAAPATGSAAGISVDMPLARNTAALADRQPWRPSLTTLLLLGWAAGMALFLLPVATGVWQVRRFRRDALPWQQGQAMADTLALEAGVGRRVEALLSADLSGPMTCGVSHPAVVLPQDAETWAAEDLARALVHELEHVRRGDWVTHCLARGLCAVYWFHPLVWILWSKLTLEAERACDDAVLGRSEATAYADQLVDLAKRLSTSAKPPLLAMASRADLTARVNAVLDGGQRRGRAGKRFVAMACLAAALLVGGLAPLKMVAAPQAAEAKNGDAQLPEFTSETTMVLANATVSDRDGKPIEGLRPADFVVTEDGVRQMLDVVEMVKTDTAPGYYVLGYYARPPVGGQYYKIEVTTPGKPEATLTFKNGYYGEAFYRPGPGAGAAGRATQNDGVTPPIPRARPEPQYSEEARKQKWQGTVTLRAEVDATGQVSHVTVARSLGLGLDEKAVQAATQWKFMPAQRNGMPVAMPVQIAMMFRLR